MPQLGGEAGFLDGCVVVRDFTALEADGDVANDGVVEQNIHLRQVGEEDGESNVGGSRWEVDMGQRRRGWRVRGK